ncbi:hypothetical protein PVAP13_5NG371800 [Panicum virgatum]|uniref:Uncharacterized protein n=1 Tax=Panicum virgatum TaxID=38727 RepID=A0A8T0RVN9_PANVG|nr:hypothetical protein PVAP13_5NG371800 [Panicum virgatum]
MALEIPMPNSAARQAAARCRRAPSSLWRLRSINPQSKIPRWWQGRSPVARRRSTNILGAEPIGERRRLDLVAGHTGALSSDSGSLQHMRFLI